jgi:hypothetical protein
MADDQEYRQPPDADSPPPSAGSRGCGLIGCILIIALLAALGAGVFLMGNALEPLADKYLWAPHDVVREYLAAYERDDTERARTFTCTGISAARLPDPAAPLGAPTAWTAGVEDQFPYPRANGRVGIYYTLRSGLGERRGQALLQREEDGWRICEFTD